MVYKLRKVAFVTLLERKIFCYMQKRKGPNKLGVKGILQPFSDAIKLLSKESLRLRSVNPTGFQLRPITYPSILGGIEVSLPINYLYSMLPVSWSLSYFRFRLRAVAQTISYEVRLAIIILSLVIVNSSFRFTKLLDFKEQIILLLLPLAILWLISAFAETNRTPFDFAGEFELVSICLVIS
ncbi:NADH-ubiquinone oxidoreductase chain 1 [Armadillidium nasatum]|uniref:NADH-ubiquinone oxidoreductase chain 1 n=1 Tax=Armadillidium nasatum TaxID=96803 RepID=A0A5N5TMK2_9CRUS|nr:NADH-ubiquinone oxidoreductase chain 1 [Armadillidium nasatum]